MKISKIITYVPIPVLSTVIILLATDNISNEETVNKDLPLFELYQESVNGGYTSSYEQWELDIKSENVSYRKLDDNVQFNIEDKWKTIYSIGDDIPVWLYDFNNENLVDYSSYYTVNFNTNTSKEIEYQIVLEGDKANQPTNPILSNYEFIGWFNGEELYNFDSVVTSQLNLNAEYEGDKYTISYNVNGGDNLINATQEVVFGQTYKLPTPTKTNCIFMGWFNGNTQYTDGEWNETKNVELTAMWKELTEVFTITYNVNGGEELSYTSQKFITGSNVTLLTPTREKHDFLGWYSNDAQYNSGVWYLTEDVELTAMWKERTETYTITYDVNGGSSLSNNTQEVIVGEKYSLVTPTRAGYIFEGWLLNGTLIQDGTWTTKSNVTLVASWFNATSLITFDSNGGSSVSQTIALYGNYVTLPIPTKDNYVFNGWMYNYNIVENGTWTLKGDVTLVAQWVDATSLVIFDVNGGNELDSISQQVLYGDNITLPTPNREGYIFTGWYNNSTLVESGEWLIKGNTVLVATWKLDTVGTPVIYIEGNIVYTLKDNVYVVSGYVSQESFEANILSSISGVPVTQIQEYAFSGSNLTKVTIPYGIETIGTRAFEGCSLIEELVIPGSVQTISTYAFFECTSLRTVVIEEGVTSIGTYAFQYCSSLISVTIPGTVKTVGSYSFQYCSSLKFVTIEEGVTTLQTYAFSYCYALVEISLPSTITNVGSYLFRYSSRLASIYCAGTSASLTTKGTSWNNVATIYYSSTSNNNIVEVNNVYYILNDYYYSVYGVNNTGNITEITIESTINGLYVLELNTYAFKDLTELTTVTIPETFTSIGTSAFYGCTSLTTVNLPDTITTLGTNAFYGCTSLETITLPSSLITIGSSAFYGCILLNNVTLPSSLTTISSSAFSGCESLTSITIPSKVTSIGDNAFKQCYSLSEVNLVDGILSFGKLAFMDCTALTTITLPSSVTTAGEYMFQGCDALEVIYSKGETIKTQGTSWNFGTKTVIYYGLDTVTTYNNVIYDLNEETNTYTVIGYVYGQSTYVIESTINGIPVTNIADRAFYKAYSIEEVIIKDGVTSIGEFTFSYSSINSITLPNTVTSIGRYSFAYCYELIEVNLSESLVELAEYAFYNCTSLETIYIPNNIKTINTSSFYNCTNLKSVVMEGVVTIQGYAFYKNSNLSEIVLSDTLVSIGDYAFGYCTSIFTITLPSTVTTVGDYVFRYCTKLNSIVCVGSSISSTGTSWNNSKTVYYNSASNGLVTINNATYSYDGTSYTLVSVSGTETFVIEESINDIPVTAVNTYAFVSSGVKTLTINDNIATYTFVKYFDTLEHLTLLGNVESIAASSFVDCASIKTITLPETIVTIGNYAFQNCTSLESINLPETLTSLGTYAFDGCTTLKTITIPSSLTAISNYTFRNCESLEIVNLPETLLTIGGYVFEGCTSLASIVLPSSITSISYQAFKNCTSLTSIVLPNEMTVLYSNTFYGCTSLESVTIPNNLVTISTYSFAYCTSLKSITLPDTVTTIASNSFLGCESLTEVTIPSSVTTISSNAFKDNISLKTINIPTSVTTISSSAFENCISLENVTLPSSVTSIETGAFIGYSGVIYYEGTVTAISVADTNLAISYKFLSFVITFDNVVYRYDSLSKTYSVAGFTNELENAIILSEIDGKAVTSIENNAFNGCTTLKTVYISENIKTIGSDVFKDCSSLTKIIYNGNSSDLNANENWNNGVNVEYKN